MGLTWQNAFGVELGCPSHANCKLSHWMTVRAARLCSVDASDSSCGALQASHAAKTPRFATTPEGLNLIATQFHGQPLTSQRRVSNRHESWQSRQAIQSRALEFAAVQEAQLQAQAAAEQQHSLLDAVSDWPPGRAPPQPPPQLPASARGKAGPTELLNGPVNGGRQQQDGHQPHASASLPAASKPGDSGDSEDLDWDPSPRACARSSQPAAAPAALSLRQLLMTPIALMTPPAAELTQFLTRKQAGGSARPWAATEQPAASARPWAATEQPVASAWDQSVASSSQPRPRTPPPRTTAPLLPPISLSARNTDEAVARALQVRDTLSLPFPLGSLSFQGLLPLSWRCLQCKHSTCPITCAPTPSPTAM